MRVKSGVTNYGLGLLYEADDAGNTKTYHYDYRGSTVAITDGIGRVTDRVEYTPYGMISFRSGATDTPFLFNGRYGVMTDPDGLLHMRARYYNPYLCRFINPDPTGFSGGMNFYAYANGNPISYLDPFGLDALAEGNMNPSWLNLGSANSTPNLQLTIDPNMNLGPFMTAAGDASPMPQAYYDPNYSSTMSVSYPQQDQYMAGLNAVASGVQLGSQIGLIALTMMSGQEEFVPNEMVTVTHFTDAATVARIQSGSGMLNVGTFVTLPGEVSGMSAGEIETTLEIDAGRGSYSTTFQTPASNLGPAFNGPITSGGRLQFQLINPTPPGPFVPTP